MAAQLSSVNLTRIALKAPRVKKTRVATRVQAVRFRLTLASEVAENLVPHFPRSIEISAPAPTPKA